ncbi:MAG: S24 family peptidase [Deltaproteobacteria bacterium]|nr:S24 family peptidase [Deltaproteobacteria bacterium]
MLAVRPDKMVLMEVFGNSMEPELKSGDSVLVDTSQNNIIAGLIYAVGIEDTILLKRVEKHPGRILLRSDNREYEPIIIEVENINSLRVIGCVIWASRTLQPVSRRGAFYTPPPSLL